MVQEAETPILELEFVSCQTCDIVFISSERRQTCPACGGEALGPYLVFTVTPEGPRLKDLNGPIAGAQTARLEPGSEPAAPAAPDEVVEEKVEGEGVSPTDHDVFVVGVQAFLEFAGINEEDLVDQLVRMGADPETAATTVGRLAAVRDTLASLTTAHPEPVEGEPAEEPAAPTPDPELAEGDGSTA